MNENQKSKTEHPISLWLVRHGESTANVARHKAEAEKLLTIDFPEVEREVPLSADGEKQARHIGNWFARQVDKPTVVFSSPYKRANETARIVLKNAGFDNLEIRFDDRLRERELGIFNRLTRLGAMRDFPEECEIREREGKFFYRPRGGENWADVGERVRSFWLDAKRICAGKNVLIFTHEAVIRLFRYVLENLTVEEILAIDRACDVGNCAVTKYGFASGAPVLETDNHFPPEY